MICIHAHIIDLYETYACLNHKLNIYLIIKFSYSYIIKAIKISYICKNILHK